MTLLCSQEMYKMAKGAVVHFGCPKCGGKNVKRANIPGMKAYECPECKHMALVEGFRRIVERDAGGKHKHGA